jgi:hypothetical protein
MWGREVERGREMYPGDQPNALVFEGIRGVWRVKVEKEKKRKKERVETDIDDDVDCEQTDWDKVRRNDALLAQWKDKGVV